MGEEKEEVQDAESAVRVWLAETVRLPQYFETLIAAGFDDLDSVAEIRFEDLNELGVQKLGHKRKLMKAIERLQPQREDAWICSQCQWQNVRVATLCARCGVVNVPAPVHDSGSAVVEGVNVDDTHR